MSALACQHHTMLQSEIWHHSVTSTNQDSGTKDIEGVLENQTVKHSNMRESPFHRNTNAVTWELNCYLVKMTSSQLIFNSLLLTCVNHWFRFVSHWEIKQNADDTMSAAGDHWLANQCHKWDYCQYHAIIKLCARTKEAKWQQWRPL